MNRVIITLAVGMLTTGPSLASDKSDIMAVLNQWNDDPNSVATCADDASVIDDIPPYEWHGPHACANWKKDYDAYLEKNGMTDATGTIGKPQQFVVTGDHAYAVLPATFAFKKDGKPVKLMATATFSLHKTAAGWRITGWAWAAQAGQ